MALIAMAVYDTEQNNRSWMTEKTLDSLSWTVNFDKHRLIIIDNGSCENTQKLYAKTRLPFTLLKNETNNGTARAINRAWSKREPGEHCLKMDNDVAIKEMHWLDKLEECIERDERIGIIGLKRKDLDEWPLLPHTSHYRSRLQALPHSPGQTWLAVEVVNHVMGTCQLYNTALLDKIGYLYQMGGLYGFDDSLAAIRCKKAGFYSCFYPHYNIDHLDPGGDNYLAWKQQYAGEHLANYYRVKAEYESGARPIYHGPNDE